MHCVGLDRPGNGLTLAQVSSWNIKGITPENSHVVFCPNKQRSFEPSTCSDRDRKANPESLRTKWSHTAIRFADYHRERPAFPWSILAGLWDLQRSSFRLRLPATAQELWESRGGGPGLPVPNGNSPYGRCGRKATLNLNSDSCLPKC